MKMQNYTLAQAKRDFELGYLKSWRIEKVPMGGWLVSLGSGVSAGHLADVRTKQARVFKSLDGAVSTVEAVGFQVNALLHG